MEEKIIPVRAEDTTPQTPWPISRVNENLRNYVSKLPSFWVEAEIVEYNNRPGTNIAFIQLRDLVEKASIQAYAYSQVLDNTPAQIQASSRITALVTPDFWKGKGTLVLRINQIKVDGIGDVLLRIEQLRKTLLAEGLFDPARKKPLPFIPNTIGLICGRDAKAKHDVLENTALRWNAKFEIREVAVQGEKCVTEVLAALQELEAHPNVDVIIIARGGGSVEDLLPFSDEKLVRTAANCTKPIISAIGHETDCPLLDFVADYRASTPTDAAIRVVPSFDEEVNLVEQSHVFMGNKIRSILDKEKQSFENYVNRPSLKNPVTIIEKHETVLNQYAYSLRVTAKNYLQKETQILSSLDSKIQALSPKQTMQRGYSVTTDSDGKIIKSITDLQNGQNINIYLADGQADAQIVSLQGES